MTPPPEQYVIEARPRALPGAVALRVGGIPLDLILVPGADAVATLTVALLAHFLWAGPPVGSAILLLVSLLLGAGSWERRAVNLGAIDDGGELLRRVAFGYAVAVAATTLMGSGGDRATLYTAATAYPALLLGRFGARAGQRALARSGRRSRTIVVGTGPTARQLIEAVAEDADYGLEIVGAVGGSKPGSGAALGTRVLGPIDSLDELASARRARTIVIASDDADDPGTLGAVRRLLERDVEVWVVPRFFQIGSIAHTHHIGAIPVVKLLPPTHKRPGWALKRAFDFAVSSVGLVLCAPVMLAVALAVKLDSSGPVLFRQERVGLGGAPIYILKFRTMRPASMLREQTEWEPDATRITRLGRFLRSTSLDELPQLFNVLRGELTLVGPRPERPVFVKMFEEMYPDYGDRHRVPAGVTGWAQIHGLRGDTSIEARARFDNHYIESWSLARDLKVLLLTARTLLPRYRPPAPATRTEEDPDRERDLADAG